MTIEENIQNKVDELKEELQNSSNQIAEIKDLSKKIHQINCQHKYIEQIDSSLISTIVANTTGFHNAVRCSDCKIYLECDHVDSELEDGRLNCVVCGREIDPDEDPSKEYRNDTDLEI